MSTVSFGGSLTRRALLKTGVQTGVSVAALATLSRPLLVRLGHTWEPVPPIRDPRLKALALRALDAAKSAGAAYADVRLTHTRGSGEFESITVGVRALAQGYWGFASSPVWDVEEMARLGQEAAHQAKTNALGKPRVVELAPTPVVADGHWETPLQEDPTRIPLEEIADFSRAHGLYGLRLPNTLVGASYGWGAQEWAFGSTEGSYCTQRLTRSGGSVSVRVTKGERSESRGGDFELLRAQPLHEEEIRALREELLAELALPVKPIEVGRYDTVLDAYSMAGMLGATFGWATQLDVALGYEANAGGTSYLNQPFEMLGSYQAAVPLVTVTADRSERGSLATVKWDDEGVSPEPFTLIKDGVLVDFQTNREAAGWLAASYAKRGVPVRSHGCAAAEEGINPPLVGCPNLTLAPGRAAQDFDALVAGLGTGMAISAGSPIMDWQGLNGTINTQGARFYEVKRGKRVARIASPNFNFPATLLFRAPEFWKGLIALGGPASARRSAHRHAKGQPAQSLAYSVTAVPAVVKQLTFIDPARQK